jgi:hypothetical protein
MRRSLLWCGVALLAVVPARAQEAPAPKVVLDVWDAVYIEGAKSGHAHTTVQEIDHDGQKAYRTNLLLKFSIKRYQRVVTLRVEQGTTELANGRILALSATQHLDNGQSLTVTGRVEGDRLLVSTSNGQAGKELPWDGKALGLYMQQRVLGLRKLQPGDRFRYHNFEPLLLADVPVTVEAQKREDQDVLTLRKDRDGTRVERVKKSLLRVTLTPDKVKAGGGEVQLPKMVLWLDDKYQALRSETEQPGVGRMTMYRTSREVAEKEGAGPALLPDLGLTTLIPLKKPLVKPHEAKEIVYRVTVKGDLDPAAAFARDARQEVRNVQGKTFELVVRAVREPAAVERPAPAGKEFLESSYFLDSDNPRVKALAARIVGAEADPLGKARKIEAWLSRNMKPNAGIGFAAASQVCRDLEGDCRQHAMLMAALCRAVGVPARTAVGVIYVNDGPGPGLGFHMWTEVYVRGQWFVLDAIWGLGSVGPDHLKITDHSWRDVETLAPLLPVIGVLGKVQVEVLSVK